MVFIMSSERDQTTNHIIAWLLYFKQGFIKLNDEESITIEFISMSNDSNQIILGIRGKEYLINNFKSFWYRRGQLNLKSKIDLGNEANSKHIHKKVKQFLDNEWLTLSEYVIQQLQNRKKIGDYFKRSINKLNVLHTAQSCGLDIPKTSIFQSSEYLNYFGTEKIITKAIQSAFSASHDNKAYFAYTSRVSNEQKSNSKAFPSLIQQEIEKKYEVRVFFIEEEFFSMAIFSQSDYQTQVDFRKYNIDKPNRNIPYKLPNDIKHKLLKLNKKLDLDTGSIDMIVSKDNRFYFLEINPIGQFGMVSQPCNYYLEKKVALYLSNGK